MGGLPPMPPRGVCARCRAGALRLVLWPLLAVPVAHFMRSRFLRALPCTLRYLFPIVPLMLASVVPAHAGGSRLRLVLTIVWVPGCVRTSFCRPASLSRCRIVCCWGCLLLSSFLVFGSYFSYKGTKKY